MCQVNSTGTPRHVQHHSTLGTSELNFGGQGDVEAAEHVQHSCLPPRAPSNLTAPGDQELPPQLLLAVEPVGPVQHHSLHLGCEEEELLQEEQAPTHQVV